jgi:cytochrome P450
VLVLTRPPVRDAAHFHDPERFHPARWLEPPDAGPHDPSTHLPFGTGPRICPGRSLALLEMKVVLAMLYKSFSVNRHGSASRVEEKSAFTMAPSGLEVRLARRPA